MAIKKNARYKLKERKLTSRIREQPKTDDTLMKKITSGLEKVIISS